MSQLVHTLTAEDQRHQHVLIADPSGHKHWLRLSFGPILFQDIGKRVYAVRADDGERYVLQVENDDQLLARLAKETKVERRFQDHNTRSWLE